MLKELDPVCSSFVHRAGLGGLAGDAGPCAGKLHDPGRYHRSALRNAGYPAPGWYGWAYLTFGNDGTVLAARLVDLNNGYKDHPSHVKADGSGNFAGDEILTYTIDGVGSF